MAWHEFPLMIFTVFAQTAVGAFLLVCLMLLFGRPSEQQKTAMIKSLFFVWVLMGIGFAASTFHLGSPLRAFNAFNRVGHAWLSNEILTGSVFFALGGLFWLLSVLNLASAALRKGLMLAAMVMGIFFMYAMARLYMIETVPTWNTVYTPLSFILTAVIAGSIFACALLTGSGYRTNMVEKQLPILGGLGVIASILVSFTQLHELAHIHTSIISASELLPNIGMLKAIQYLLLVVALVLWWWPTWQRSQRALVPILMGTVCVLFAEFLGRGIFYSLHMTVGL
ncbi:dimethyl sulfoxide reductase anchor subunit [Vibrio sp. V27_P1S3P104]|uniref:dimethyl sulfoxide reductase anchor subunit family protein n=1 Tax=unclassified Vibrio TaxID=2614977 RepID=UPI001373009E|nr:MULTISPECIES: dimethyl sulfoxide reductase anchor subunit family protein [unclassified Vibrio]NAW68925.1 dimethyl sulfoxide reductase anchor subunit [Vibrio sp. V28_P6S34P95]NAX05134.1 dimethyl sulfoxide reductase anchor subunit [Vibrio sp. V30_P3S12P165]NAX33362.1 dimethyl sulfoxide reductase anchor subunit [Vibrio sp. V29_P1S30P107]NAX37614.1 dimethyl sulfoxide reductase anchor subunit [Vibrio sp. V27_P1S3P104]NAX40311.1 dimethyl sulfoxide reductase anchor subunit [Vibrio sp. V26_P1S5P106